MMDAKLEASLTVFLEKRGGPEDLALELIKLWLDDATAGGFTSDDAVVAYINRLARPPHLNGVLWALEASYDDHT